MGQAKLKLLILDEVQEGYEGFAPLHPQKFRCRDVEADIRGIDRHVWQYQAVPTELLCTG